MKIKLIKPFYGHNNYRSHHNPISIGKVLDYQNNPKRAKNLIKQGIAIEYKEKNMISNRITEEEDWKEGMEAFRRKSEHLTLELSLIVEDLHKRLRIIELSEQYDEYNKYAEDIDLQAFAQGRKSSNDYNNDKKKENK